MFRLPRNFELEQLLFPENSSVFSSDAEFLCSIRFVSTTLPYR